MSPETTANSSISASVNVRAMLALSPGEISSNVRFSIVAAVMRASVSMDFILSITLTIPDTGARGGIGNYLAAAFPDGLAKVL